MKSCLGFALAFGALCVWVGCGDKGTPADAARLHFRAASAVWACLECGHQQAKNAKDLCPSCGSHRLKAGAGHAFYLEALDVETRQEPAGEGQVRGQISLPF